MCLSNLVEKFDGYSQLDIHTRDSQWLSMVKPFSLPIKSLQNYEPAENFSFCLALILQKEFDAIRQPTPTSTSTPQPGVKLAVKTLKDTITFQCQPHHIYNALTVPDVSTV